MPSNFLPAEIWCQILRESISIPSFLDSDRLLEVVDPLYDCFFSTKQEQTEAEYWKTERYRVNLRCVCRSWDAYLRHFDHRFIRVSDICHGYIPAEALRSAIRVYYSICQSNCPICLPMEEQEGALLAPLVAKLGQLSVEILSWTRGQQSNKILETLTNMISSMPSLRVIMEHNGGHHGLRNEWPEVISLSPKLKFVKCSNYLELSDWPSISSSSLTVLEFSSSNNCLSIPLEKFHLPSLRHLRFTGPLDNIWQDSHRLVPILKAVGHNLLSLKVGNNSSWETIPHEVWNLCPLLERLDTGFCFRHPPPLDHPLHTVSVAFSYTGENVEKMRSMVVFPSPLRDWPSVRRVVIVNLSSCFKPFVPKENRIFLLEYINTCKERRMIIEDENGVLLEGGDVRDIPERVGPCIIA